MNSSLNKILLISFSLVATLGFAQDEKAKAILDELSEKTRQYPTITSEFTFTLEDKAAEVNEEQQGMLKMKGKKYFIQLADNQIFSDGETMWTYSEEMNEVYIDYAEGEEGALNPSEVYTIWESGFKQYYKGEESMSGKAHHVIKLVPNEPADKNYHTIFVYVDKAKMEVSKIEIKGKQGMDYTYSVKTFVTNASYSDGDFTFDSADYPGVDEIDNR